MLILSKLCVVKKDSIDTKVIEVGSGQLKVCQS